MLRRSGLSLMFALDSRREIAGGHNCLRKRKFTHCAAGTRANARMEAHRPDASSTVRIFGTLSPRTALTS